MKLDGIHHITAITADAQRNVDFYVGVLGLRLVKKSVNQDDPTVYHLFYGDEDAHPGLDLTFFEYPGAAPGRAGDGMIHRVVWRVAGPGGARLLGRAARPSAGIETERNGDSLLFADPEGLDHELLVADVSDAPLIAEHPEIPAEHALQGFHAVRAFSSQPDAQPRLLETLGFEPAPTGRWEARGDQPRLALLLRRAARRARHPGRGHASTTWPGPPTTRTTRPGASESRRAAGTPRR